MDLKEFTRRKELVERLRRDRDRAQGALAQTVAADKEKYGVETLEELKALARKARKQAERDEAAYDRLAAEWDQEFGEKVG